MANRPRFRLTDLDLDEISTVWSGDDPTADILIVKSAKCSCSNHTGTERNMKGEKVCERCGGLLSKMTGPTGPSLMVDSPLSSEFKHKDKMKSRRKKSRKKMREEAMMAIDKMETKASRRNR